MHETHGGGDGENVFIFVLIPLPIMPTINKARKTALEWKKSATFIGSNGFFVPLQQRCNVGGISHVGVARCAGFGMTICVFFCLYKLHHIKQFPICYFAFELNRLPLICDLVNTEIATVMYSCFSSNSGGFWNPFTKICGCSQHMYYIWSFNPPSYNAHYKQGIVIWTLRQQMVEIKYSPSFLLFKI